LVAATVLVGYLLQGQHLTFGMPTEWHFVLTAATVITDRGPAEFRGGPAGIQTDHDPHRAVEGQIVHATLAGVPVFRRDDITLIPFHDTPLPRPDLADHRGEYPDPGASRRRDKSGR
jgi:hypothetical protein